MYIITCVNAEHSKYLTAPSSRVRFHPCSLVIGCSSHLDNCWLVVVSILKSIWVPINIKGVFLQWEVISGIHWKNVIWTSFRVYTLYIQYLTLSAIFLILLITKKTRLNDAPIVQCVHWQIRFVFPSGNFLE